MTKSGGSGQFIGPSPCKGRRHKASVVVTGRPFCPRPFGGARCQRGSVCDQEKKSLRRIRQILEPFALGPRKGPVPAITNGRIRSEPQGHRMQSTAKGPVP